MAKLTPREQDLTLLARTQEAKIRMLESDLADVKRHAMLMSQQLADLSKKHLELFNALTVLHKFGL